MLIASGYACICMNTYLSLRRHLSFYVSDNCCGQPQYLICLTQTHQCVLFVPCCEQSLHNKIETEKNIGLSMCTHYKVPIHLM